MIDFNRPIRLRGIHGAYAQFLSTERGQLREGGVNVFQRIMDCYMAAVLIGLKHNRTASVDDSKIRYEDIFGKTKKDGDTIIPSSDISSDTVHAAQQPLNYIYKIVMLTENERGLSDAEKIANAFKSDTNEEKVSANIELMHSYARGGIEYLYDEFSGLKGNEADILAKQLEIFDSLGDYDLSE